MAIDTECPLCGHKGRVPEKFAGKQIKCKECCNVFHVGGGGPSDSHAGTETIGAGSQAGTDKVADFTAGKTSPGASKAGSEKAGMPVKKADEKRARSDDTHHGPMKVMKPSGSSQGTAAKVVKPGGSNHGPPRKPAKAKAASFDTLDYHQGSTSRRRRRSPSMLPLVFSLFLLAVVVVAGIIVYDKMFGTAASSSQVASTDAAKTDAAKTEDMKAAETKVDEPPPPEDFVDVSKGPFRYGPISIRVTSAGVAPVKLKGAEPKPEAKEEPKADAKEEPKADAKEEPKAKDAKEEPKAPAFVVKLEIDNQGTKRVDYQGWGTTEPINDINAPLMTDSNGKAYKRQTFGPGAALDGMVLAESIQPGKTISDVVVFDMPDDTGAFVRIELSAENLGKPGKIRLEVPKALYGDTLIVKKEVPKLDPKEPPKPPEETATVALLRGELKKAQNVIAITKLITALGEQGPAAYSAIPDLLKHAKSPNEIIKIEVLLTLAKIGPVGAKESVPVMLAALKDPSDKVRVEAANALGKLGPFAKEALPTLVDLATKEKIPEVIESVKEAVKLIEAM